MKKITKYFLFALVYLVVIFLVLEAVLRIIFPPTTLLPPNYNGNVETSEYNMLIKTNSIGLRGDREYATDKPAGTVRILAVGDSFTFGTGVNNSDTWAQHLENKLNAAGGKQYQVMNAGKPGIGPGVYFTNVKNLAKKYDVDFVVIGFFVNDLKDVSNPYIGFSDIFKQSRLITLTYSLVKDIPYSQEYAAEKGVSPALIYHAKKYPTMIKDLLFLDTPEMNESLRETEDVMLQMHDYLEENKIPSLFVVIPAAQQIDIKYHEFFSKIGFELTPDMLTKPILQKELTTFFTKNKIDYLDMLPLLKASCTDCYYFKDNHWNIKGTEFAGSEIYDKFKELQFTNKV